MIKIMDNLSRIFKRNSVGNIKSITGAIDNSLNTLKDDLGLLEAEYVITTSSGSWLDEYGSWFGIPRILGETDDSYRNRIIALTTKPKITVSALTQITRAYVGDPKATVIVYEPYVNIARFNQSLFSGADKFQDETYYRMGTIELISPAELTQKYYDTINQARSAGVKVYFTKMVDINSSGDGGAVSMNTGTEKLSSDWYLEKDLRADIAIQVATYSGGFYNFPRSGYKNLWLNMQRELELRASMPQSVLNSFDRDVYIIRVPSRDSQAFRSGYTGGYSGYPLSEWDTLHPTAFVDTGITLDALSNDPKSSGYVYLGMGINSYVHEIQLDLTAHPVDRAIRSGYYLADPQYRPMSGRKTMFTSNEIQPIVYSQPYNNAPTKYGGTQVHSNYKEILAGSYMPIDLIWDTPIDEVKYISDYALAPIESESIPV